MEKTLVYACRTKDREILAKSSSGGAFTAISDYFLDRGDAVLCSSYDYDGHRARFGLAFTKEERDAARGSMYMGRRALRGSERTRTGSFSLPERDARRLPSDSS